MEQLNILNDLVGQLHGTETKALSDIIVTDEQSNNIGSMFSWVDTFKKWHYASLDSFFS